MHGTKVLGLAIMDNPVFRLKTKDIDPVIALREATARIVNQYEEFGSLFAAASK